MLIQAILTFVIPLLSPLISNLHPTNLLLINSTITKINLGPLLYHWANDVEHNEDTRYQQSIELSWEEVRHVIGTYGFEFNKEVTHLVAIHDIFPLIHLLSLT